MAAAPRPTTLALVLVALLFGLLCFAAGLLIVLARQEIPLPKPPVPSAASGPAAPAAAPAAAVPADKTGAGQKGAGGKSPAEPAVMSAVLAPPLSVPPPPGDPAANGGTPATEGADAAAAVLRDTVRPSDAAAQGAAAYCIQVGIFRETTNAARLAESLRQQGFSPTLYRAPADPAWVTLAVGRYAGVAEASGDLERLRNATGLVGVVRLVIAAPEKK